MIVRKIVAGACLTAYALSSDNNKECFIYRKDIGAYWGIKGYEETVSEVGTEHGRNHWPQYQFLGTFDAASVRRGFQVFTNNCANCHGMMFRKYDFLLDRIYDQIELSSYVAEHFTIHPAHHHYKQHYYQEWDYRPRYITDHIYSPYFSQDQGKNANGGVKPSDFYKMRLKPGEINYVYNILNGYHYIAPFGLDVVKGKHLNPYFDHMIMGMPRQLFDGMIDYEDGTPASTPQMAVDVANFIAYMQRRDGARAPDKKIRNMMFVCGIALAWPIFKLRLKAIFRGMWSYRFESYAVRDNLGYKHWKTGQISIRAADLRGSVWS